MRTIGVQLALFWKGLTGALGRILGSRKMLLGIISLGLIVAVNLAPELSARAESIGNLIFVVYSVLVAGVTIEDSVDKWANRPKNVEAAIEAIKAELEQPKGTVG